MTSRKYAQTTKQNQQSGNTTGNTLHYTDSKDNPINTKSPKNTDKHNSIYESVELSKQGYTEIKHRRKKSEIWDTILDCLKDRPHTRHDLHIKTGMSDSVIKNAIEDMSEMKLIHSQEHTFRCKDRRNKLGYTYRKYWHLTTKK